MLARLPAIGPESPVRLELPQRVGAIHQRPYPTSALFFCGKPGIADTASSSLLAVGLLQRLSYSGIHLCVQADEGRRDEATQDGPVAPDVALAILDAAHHHLRDVAQPHVDVRPGQPGWQFIVGDRGVEKGIPHLSSAHRRRSRSDHSFAKAGAIGVEDVPCQGVAAGVVGGVEDFLDDLIGKAALPRDRFACPGEQCPRVPGDQLEEQVVAIGEVAIDVGPRQSGLRCNVVHCGLADSVAVDAAFRGSQDALTGVLCAPGRDCLSR
jgi:hypothetical protein